MAKKLSALPSRLEKVSLDPSLGDPFLCIVRIPKKDPKTGEDFMAGYLQIGYGDADPNTFGPFQLVTSTLELPWKDNESYVSCIPDGWYKVVPRKIGNYYAAYKKRWGHKFSLEIKDVGKREVILIHTGNYLKDTQGCILLGHSEGSGDEASVFSSRENYRHLYNLIEDALEKNGSVKLLIARGNGTPETFPTDAEELDRSDL